MSNDPINLPVTIMGRPVTPTELPNSRPLDAFLFGPLSAVQTSAAPAEEITLESILAAVEKLKAIPRPEYDAFICLPDLWDCLLREFGSAVDVFRGFSRLYGIPIYRAADDMDAVMIFTDLLAAGIRPRILQERPPATQAPTEDNHCDE